MSPLLTLHIASGIVALNAAAVAVGAAKGGTLHRRAGSGFAAAMVALGLTATLLSWQRVPFDPGLGGLMTCYFVATGWATARWRLGRPGRFEIVAGAVALLTGAGMLAAGIAGSATTPVGQGPIFAVGGLCLLAGLLDLSVAWRGWLVRPQRLARHLWRMCFACFIATGSFFLGQQQVLPAALRGSALLYVLAFAPFAVMLFWLVRVRLARRFAEPRPAAV